MLLLAFRLGGDRYAFQARHVIEVLPLVEIRPVPHAPRGVAGFFDFRGIPVPVIDLSVLMIAQPSRWSLSTRLVIVGYPDSAGRLRPLGLIVEKATRMLERQPGDFVDSGISTDSAAYLGPVASDDNGLLQCIDVQRVLPAAVRDVLFTQPKEPAP